MQPVPRVLDFQFWQRVKTHVCTCSKFVFTCNFNRESYLSFKTNFSRCREIHPLDPQPNRHSMLVPRVCAPRVMRWSLGRSRDLCSKQAAERLTGWVYRLSSNLGQIGCRGSENWWRMHSAHSLSTALSSVLPSGGVGNFSTPPATSITVFMTFFSTFLCFGVSALIFLL